MKILHVSTFSPTPCGIATYTEELIANLPEAEALRLRMVYDGESSSGNFLKTVSIHTASAYDSAIQAINESDSDVVSLQHEFGIYGGPDGQLVTRLAGAIRKPIVTTLHTTSATFSPTKHRIIQDLMNISKFVVVLSEESGSLLRTEFAESANKVRVIRHGIPCVEFTMPSQNARRRQIDCDLVFVSAGHMRPSKGYNTALEALARFKKSGIAFRYLIIGTSQPQWDTSRQFPQQTRARIHDLGLEREVIWIERYLGLDDLLHYIQAADIGLVTYTESDQISTGILPMVLGCGRPVVATNFDGAKSAARLVDGVYLAEINQPESVCAKINEVIQQHERLLQLMHTIYSQTRPWLWKSSGSSYRRVFEQAARTSSEQ